MVSDGKIFGIIPIYGLLIVTGIVIGIIGCCKEGKRKGLGNDVGLDLALWCVPLAVICSRLYYVAFKWADYKNNLLSILEIWHGGLAIYGGVIGGVIGGILYAKHRKTSFFTLSDIVAPFLILAQAIGRWGNFANGEAFGMEITNPSLQFFPIAVNVGGVWHMATFFYESVWDLTGFILLFLYGRKDRPRGTLSVLYLVWYGLGRSVIEGLRTDSLYIGGTGIRVSQALSILFVLLGCAHLLSRHIKAKRTAAQDTEQV